MFLMATGSWLVVHFVLFPRNKLENLYDMMVVVI